MVDTKEPENRLAGDKGFKNKTILITGGTGFLGKVLIEKILRTCPLVKEIYVIVRNKKGVDPQLRLKEMFKNPFFDTLKKTVGKEILKKVVAIPGDIMETDLGLTDAYRKLLTENIEIIYNMAASTRFDDPMKKAILVNTRSAREVIKLAKECKKLLTFIHVSTAYSFPQERVLLEKLYPTKEDPDDIIQIAETMKEEIVEEATQKCMKPYPNTYAFSKALAETLVGREMDNLPVIIVRPSIVIPIWKDPIPGWTDNIFGPMGLLVAAGKGILRTMYCKSKGYADFLPADVFTNALMVGTYDFLNNKSRRVFHVTSSSEIKVTWGEIIETGKKVVTNRMPFNWVVWYPGGNLKSSRFLNNVCVVLFHLIPAIILDGLLVLTGNKPVLWKIHQKIIKASALLEYFANNQWDFNNSAALQVRKLMNETEKRIYKVDPEGLVIEDYFYDCIHSTRQYILKETDETLPTARRHMKIMWTVDKFCKIFILMGIVYFLIRWFFY